MDKEAVDLLLAIVDFLLYPRNLSPDDSKERDLLRCAELFRKKARC